tara:strand:+ start:94 stop:276 length:183 start_codon:yes stop_codon:yes gene_type:complete
MANLKGKSEIEKAVQEAHEEIMDAPLREFIQEADSLGYSFFCKDIVKKIITARVHKKIKA